MFEREVAFNDSTRGVVDLDTGEFPATLSTNGEASDGHIVNVRGWALDGDALPMMFGHRSTEQIPGLGSFRDFTVEQRDGYDHLRTTGRINLNGDPERDALVGIRVGIAQLMHDGDMRGLSMRWDPIGSPVPRARLAADHPAHAGREASPLQRSGVYFDTFAMREGSVVGIGADPKSLAGRADHASTPLERTFWRHMEHTSERSETQIGDVLAALTEIRSGVEALRAAGGSELDVVNALDTGAVDDGDALVRYEFEGGSIYLPRAAWVSLQEENVEILREANASLVDAAQRCAAVTPLDDASPNTATPGGDDTSSRHTETLAPTSPPVDAAMISNALGAVFAEVVPRMIEQAQTSARDAATAAVRSAVARRLGRLDQ